MRNKFLCLAMVVAIPLLYLQPPSPSKEKEPPPPTKKVSEYKKELDDMKTWTKNLTNDKFYDDRFKFKEKKTEKEMKFSDFPEFDRRMFKMTTTQRFNRHLDSLEEAWQNDLKKVRNKIPDSKGKEDAVAGADDVAKFVEDLVKLRKDAVLTWEEQANSVFKDYPKEFEEKDKALYLKNIKTLKESLESR